MNIYWGDLHNHCGITYGLGSLENALEIARSHLDFVSVTPHAFWPDIPLRTPDTEFLVDFHERGFAKIAKNWDTVKKTIDAANDPGSLTTFFSFEMHSSRWGDYHFLSPDSNLKIARLSTPTDVIAAQSARTIAIPHHIGYTPGYRGIDWEGFDERISPVVEVVSKHGCAMHERASFPYYHDMGPLDPRNTVYQGLKMGKRFGFIGSTDHHAGMPGSYGDGKLAVVAKENTRESIFDAIRCRRTYAVTGARIGCAFHVNGQPMGVELEPAQKYAVHYRVDASNAIDRVVLYRNLKPVRILDGLCLPEQGGKYKLCLELGWGDNLDEPYPWEVSLHIANGRLTSVEPCLRGRSVLSPNQRVTAGDEINRPTFKMKRVGEDALWMYCETYRNNSTLSPSTTMLIIEIEGGNDTLVEWEINGRKICKTIGDLLDHGLSGQMKSYNSQAFKLHSAVPMGRYLVEGEWTLPEDGAALYHMEVRQFDGNAAYISPVYIRREGSK